MEVVDPDVSPGAVHKETLHHNLPQPKQGRKRRRNKVEKEEEDRMKAGGRRKIENGDKQEEEKEDKNLIWRL